MKEFFRLSFLNLKNRKLRSWLTIIGIIIGVTAVVALYSLGKGMENSITEQFQRIGIDKLIVTAKSPIGPFAELVNERVTPADAEQIRKVRGVEEVAEIIVGFLQLKFRDDVEDVIVRGVSFGDEFLIAEEVLDLNLDRGRFLDEGEKGAIVIGSELARENNIIFGKAIGLGDRVQIKEEQFKVVGILKSNGRPEVDRAVLTEIDVVRVDIFGEPERTDIIGVKLQEGEDVSAAAERVKNSLRRFRGVEEGEEDFEVQTFESAFETFFNIINIVTYIVLAITIVSLFVGGVGVMNTMSTSVLERRKEIGIMKAVGARNRDVATLFLAEAGILGLIGGSIGLLLGVLLAQGISFVALRFLGFPLLQPVYPAGLFVGVFAFTFLIGVIFGTYPAYKAAQVEPVDAIRGV